MLSCCCYIHDFIRNSNFQLNFSGACRFYKVSADLCLAGAFLELTVNRMPCFEELLSSTDEIDSQTLSRWWLDWTDWTEWTSILLLFYLKLSTIPTTKLIKRHMKVMSDWGGATWPNLRLPGLSPLVMLFIKKACMLTQSNILARFIRTINECYWFHRQFKWVGYF